MTNPMATRSSGGIRLCSNEYFTKNATPRKSASPPIHAKSFAPMNCSQLIGGLAGAAIWGTVALTNLSGIGGGTDSFSCPIRAAVVVGTGGGTAFTATTAASDFGAGVVCRPKLRTSFSSDENRVAKSSRPRFALFALASATNGRTQIAINRPTTMRIRSSICL